MPLPPPAAAGLRWSVPGVLTIALVWLAAKWASCWWWVWRPGEFGDTYYYFLTAQDAVAHGTLTQALSEYPTPAAWLLLAPYLLGADDHDSYRGAILVMTTVADAIFTLLLGRVAGPVGVLGWIGLTTALGSLSLLRFDMFPAAVAGIALLCLVRRRRVLSGVMIALGTGLKVWPIALAPLLLPGLARTRFPAGRVRRLTGVAAFTATGMVLVAGSVAVAGWHRLLSPLSYQGERGLQIEAVVALVPMWAWGRGSAMTVGYSDFHAFEVSGPGVAGWLAAGQVLAALAFVGCALLLGRWLVRGASTVAICWLALAVVGAFIVTSPALSPQYLLWLSPPAAILLGGSDRFPDQADADTDMPRSSWRRAAVMWTALLVLCVLSTVIYPVAYDAFLTRRSDTTAALVVLSARNLGLVVFVVACFAVAWTQCGPRRPRGDNRGKPLPVISPSSLGLSASTTEQDH